jgi:hypothetical protein
MVRYVLQSDATYPVLNNEEVPIEPPPRPPARTLAEAAMRMRARRNEIRPRMFDVGGPSVPYSAIETDPEVLERLSNVERELDRYIRVQTVQNNVISTSVQNIARTNLIILDTFDRRLPKPPQ